MLCHAVGLLQELHVSVDPDFTSWQRKQRQPSLAHLTALTSLSCTGEGLFAVQADEVSRHATSSSSSSSHQQQQSSLRTVPWGVCRDTQQTHMHPCTRQNRVSRTRPSASLTHTYPCSTILPPQVLPPNLVRLVVSDCPKAAPLLLLSSLQSLAMQASTMDAAQLAQVRRRVCLSGDRRPLQGQGV
jgi:hypothetical protein